MGNQYYGGVTISERLKECRARKGWTQQQSAEYFGVSVAAYQNWENGVKPPGKDRIPVLAEWIGIPADELGQLRPKPLAALASEEANALRQQILDTKDAEIFRLRQEVSDVRIVAEGALNDFLAFREFVEPRLEFLTTAELTGIRIP